MKEPRTFIVFGPPKVGTSTLLFHLQAASLEDIEIRNWPRDNAPLQPPTKDLTFYDFPGGCITVPDIQRAVDTRTITPLSGGIVRVHAMPSEVAERILTCEVVIPFDKRTDPDYRSLRDAATRWMDDLVPVENRIRAHSLPYSVVENRNLETAVRTLAMRVGVKR